MCESSLDVLSSEEEGRLMYFWVKLGGRNLPTYFCVYMNLADSIELDSSSDERTSLDEYVLPNFHNLTLFVRS